MSIVASETITMHGPSFDGTGETEEQDVHHLNVHAYRLQGWEEGPKPEEEKTAETEVESTSTKKGK